MFFLYARLSDRLCVIVALCATLLLLSACTVSQSSDTSRANLAATEKIDVKTGKSRFYFTDWAGPDIPVWMYIPKKGKIRQMPIVIVMHGAGRDGDRYRDEWAPQAEKYSFIVIAPEFSRKKFPKSRSYNLGGVFKGKDRKYQAETAWSFSAIEPLFSKVVDMLGSRQKEYTLYGHSAGSQFVHRFLLYKQNVRVKRYIAANAGWYTTPDFEENYPYGLKGAQVNKQDLKAALKKDVVILLGDKDTDKTGYNLRRTPEAMKQGVHRFERGHFFFNQANERAKELNVDFGWKLGIVRGASHHNGQMAAAAAKLIY